MRLIEEFPELSFFMVGTQNNGYFTMRLFCTLENSIGFNTIGHFIHTGDHIVSIDIASELQINCWFRDLGVAFAEARKFYRSQDLEELREDILIAKLSGLRQ